MLGDYSLNIRYNALVAEYGEEKALNMIVDDEIKRYVESNNVPKKMRTVLSKLYPHIRKICMGEVAQIINNI